MLRSGQSSDVAWRTALMMRLMQLALLTLETISQTLHNASRILLKPKVVSRANTSFAGR